MISAWYLVPALFIGAIAGYCVLAILTVGKKD